VLLIHTVLGLQLIRVFLHLVWSLLYWGLVFSFSFFKEMVLNLEEIGFLCYLFCLLQNFLNYMVWFNLEIFRINHAHNFLLTLWDFSSWLIVLIMFLFENVILLDNLSNLFWVSEILSSRYFSTVKNRDLVFCIFMMKWGLLIDQKSFNWSSNMSKGINIPPYWPNDNLTF